MPVRNALITGGCGFVGSHLAEVLVQEGCSVTVIDNLSSGSLANLDPIKDKVNLRILDIASREFHRVVTRGEFDAIFHLAGQSYVPPSVEDPLFDFEQNLKNTLQLLEMLRIIRWPGLFIYASSGAVYGDLKGAPFTEEAQTDPIAPYGVSKLAGERYTAVYARLYGLRAAPVRFFSMYGPRQTKQVVFDIIDKIFCSPSHMQLLGDGTQMRDLCYIRDAVDGILLIARHGALRGEAYNLASGSSMSIGALAHQIAVAMGRNPKFEYTGSVRPGDPERWEVCIDRLRSLGFQPRYSIEMGIAATVEWYLKWRATTCIDGSSQSKEQP